MLLAWWSMASPAGSVPKNCLAQEPVQIIIRNDDICALSQPEWERQLLAEFRAFQFPLSVGFVPAIASNTNFDPQAQRHPITEADEILSLYRPGVEQGWIDVLQHGFDHQQNQAHAGLPPARSSEFSGLPFEQQKSRILQGRQLLQQALGVKPQVFVPPWNNADAATRRALHALGFEGLSDTQVWRLKATGDVHLPGRMVYFQELQQVLDQWYQQGQCKGELPPETVVVLYHSWSDYDPQGPARLRSYLQQLKESGIKVTTVSEALGLPSTARNGQLELPAAVLQQQ